MDKKEFDKIVTACRFCLMCRHMCTVGNLTYVETNTPRGQALMIDCMGSEALEDTPDNRKRAAEVLYECCYCGHCQNNCVSSYRHPDAIMAARAGVAEASLPETAKELRKLVQKTGEVYKSPKQVKGKTDIKGADVLLYFGSFARNKMPAAAKSAVALLDKAGIKYTTLSAESDPGMDAIFLGMPKKAQQQMDGEIKKINALGPRKLVTLAPEEQRAFSGGVPGLDAQALKAPVVGFSAYIRQLIDSKKLKLKPAGKKCVAFHDSDQGGRFLEQYAAPRELLNAVPGLQYKELFWTEGEAASAGESGLFSILEPQMAAQIAQKRWEQIDGRGVNIVITDSPAAAAQLAANAGDNKIKVLHIAEFMEKHI